MRLAGPRAGGQRNAGATLRGSDSPRWSVGSAVGTCGRTAYNTNGSMTYSGLRRTHSPPRLMRIASLVGFLLMVSAVVGLVFTHALFSPSLVVVAVQVAAVALMTWARLTLTRRSFRPAADVTGGDLVTTGPYRFIRHPIYAAACVFCWAGVLANSAVVPL